MKLKPKRLRVFPNPWGISPRVFGKDGTGSSHTATMDSQGRPCGVCPADPVRDGGDPGKLVGAWPAHEWLGKEPRPGEFRHRRQDTGYEFLGASNRETEPFALAKELAGKEPVDLMFTDYYVERIADGSLIAADEQTARTAGIEFIEPQELFGLLAKAAAECFNAHFEEEDDAYATFCKERRDEVKKAATPEPPATAKPTEVQKRPQEKSR
jgi:hypothetical protein